MANNGILSEFSPAGIDYFKKDFFQMIKVGAEIDRYYGSAKVDLDVMIPKFEKLTEQFNKKYKSLKINIRKTLDNFNVRVFVKERDIKEFFANSASKIAGMKSVGRTNSNQIEVNDIEKFASFLESLLDKVYISYMDLDSGISAVTAILDRKEKRVEIVCSPVEMMNENSAGFKICAYYALKDGFDKKIEIYGDASTFGFTNLLSEMERREWFDKFNPKFLE